MSTSGLRAQEPDSLEQRLKSVDAAILAEESRKRGDAHRGALVFSNSAAGCAQCHDAAQGDSSFGPHISELQTADGKSLSDRHIIESLLYPSKSIRQGFETLNLLTVDGQVLAGLLNSESENRLSLRPLDDLNEQLVIEKDEIESRKVSEKSLMPEGLVDSLLSERNFFDLACFLFEVADGGADRFEQLRPSPDQIANLHETDDVNHAGILRKLARRRDLQAGESIYFGHCVNCHGEDGNTPSLATARAFGQQKLKFGADPYSMFRTLSHGNGLMGATKHLSPKQRYEVIHFIRQEFMKDSNPDYTKITDEYLASLPKGSDMGDFKSSGDRDYGPALASQIGDVVHSALTIQTGHVTIAYDLHSMDQVDVWTDGFLNLDETHHQRGRGEGYPEIEGNVISGLSGWKWGHDGTLDYSREGLLPRGPLPAKWFDYHGHSICGDDVVLRYRIDGREVLETVSEVDLSDKSSSADAVRHTLRIGAGEELVLAVAKWTLDTAGGTIAGVFPSGSNRPSQRDGSAESTVAFCGNGSDDKIGPFIAATLLGQGEGMSWHIDQEHRMVLQIPADERSRLVELVCFRGESDDDLEILQQQKIVGFDPEAMLDGGPVRWPDTFTTTGYLDLRKGAYAMDTITIPDSTPWNTWFRTSALGFFPDGRMVVATLGGDIWIVSGIDAELLNVRWKRFASGLYEPFGIQVVDGQVFVTCKDRLTRLHDVNDDGEADFYESFSADTDVSTFFHAFNFDLHVDSKGNFYYAKAGQYTDYKLPGSVIKVSADGSSRSVYCTGFRTPNGMGILPDDRLTISDNQGNWMPASKICLVREGGFYGYVQTKTGGGWAPDGGEIDHRKVVPPESFDQPIVWMPQAVDNSSGGQLWVDDLRWGPLSGRLLHTSFGKGHLFNVMMQHVNGVDQAAVIKLPHEFMTGIMRGRVNPADGQVYVTGLDGWNGGGRPGLIDKGIARVRYTGETQQMVTACRVEHGTLVIDFEDPLDAESAANADAYEIQQWNYKWSGNYGSEMYHPETGKVGTEDLKVKEATLTEDGKSVALNIPDLKPVNQLRLRMHVETSTGIPFQEEIHWTINAVPETR